MTVKLLTEYNLELLSLTGGWTGLCQNATLLEITCHGSYGCADCFESSLHAQANLYLMQDTVQK